MKCMTCKKDKPRSEFGVNPRTGEYRQFEHSAAFAASVYPFGMGWVVA